jgi:hypothetical protein
LPGSSNNVKHFFTSTMADLRNRVTYLEVTLLISVTINHLLIGIKLVQSTGMISLKDSLMGAWSLIRFEQADIHGNVSYPMGKCAKGSLYYTHEGHVSVHIMQAERRSTIESLLLKNATRYHDLGYLAYSGRYRVNDSEQIVIHDIDISLYPEWIGSHQVRAISLQTNQLDLQFQQRINGELFSFRLLWFID